jgi:hypothetical protein
MRSERLMICPSFKLQLNTQVDYDDEEAWKEFCWDQTLGRQSADLDFESRSGLDVLEMKRVSDDFQV